MGRKVVEMSGGFFPPVLFVREEASERALKPVLFSGRR